MRPIYLLPLLILLSATAAVAKETILPGYWESTSRATFLVPTPPKTERRCIKPEQVDAYLNGPSTSHYKCQYTSRTVEDGVAHMRGQCHDKHGRAYDVEIHGAYAPETFKMAVNFKFSGLPIGGTASTDAHRIGAECPK